MLKWLIDKHTEWWSHNFWDGFFYMPVHTAASMNLPLSTTRQISITRTSATIKSQQVLSRARARTCPTGTVNPCPPSLASPKPREKKIYLEKVSSCISWSLYRKKSLGGLNLLIHLVAKNDGGLGRGLVKKVKHIVWSTCCGLRQLRATLWKMLWISEGARTNS